MLKSPHKVLTINLHNFVTKQTWKYQLQANQLPILIYVCGPTVYDSLHIGNFRSVFVFDVLVRFLQRHHQKVKYWQNITDIDDKIIAAAQTQQLTEKQLTQRYFHEYNTLCRASQLVRPHYLKVTDYIPFLLEFIARLLVSKHAYITNQGIYFDLQQAVDYGIFRAPTDNSLTNEIIDPQKKDDRDFALWKFKTTGLKWQSQWGAGRPGWHTECVALIERFCWPRQLTIHGGGRDLMFPHHENENAQFQALHQKSLTQFWLHTGLVKTISGKISRSRKPNPNLAMKNFLPLYGPNVLRLFYYSRPYASDLMYDSQIILNYQKICQRWQSLLIHAQRQFVLANQINWQTTKCLAKTQLQLEAKLANNLAIDKIIVDLFRLEKQLNQAIIQSNFPDLLVSATTFCFALNILGFDFTIPVWTKEQIQALSNWKLAVQAKKFSLADQIRAKLQQAGLWN